MIRVELGTRNALVWCKSCGTWRELHGTHRAALQAAARHVDQVHGEARRAADLRDRAQRLTM